MPKFYAHTKTALDGTIAPTSEWEPLFSEDCKALQGEPCAECEALDPQHGHLKSCISNIDEEYECISL
jgi:hypothetical protein